MIAAYRTYRRLGHSRFVAFTLAVPLLLLWVGGVVAGLCFTKLAQWIFTL